MKTKLLSLAIALLTVVAASAQSCYWVFLTDKAGTTFDPYSYFDAKAIERYRINNADLYDISNFPLNASYVQQVDRLATAEVGQSRWLNAVAVMATTSQIEAIRQLPFVAQTDLIATDMEIAEFQGNTSHLADMADDDDLDAGKGMFNDSGNSTVTHQLLRMQGEQFINKGIDGKGIRIAVFDGGFHAVDTHPAFKHLRDNRQIIATWDFTTKQKDVYDNHSHGTMVLSCIAGRTDDKQLGLATGSTFLLAKTEVDPEPYKEEVWWAQAMEWADKNGADIINSSLGYTKDRHYTWEMDGRSYVSKAANMAARKGMLVCNSAGNSGEDENWIIIGAPADADSILSVGGINPSLNVYSHASFSSYGPTADGRMKPNVCNFGYCEVAAPYSDGEVSMAAGTSFSSPLTAGFCACAMQAMRPEKPTAMQMKSLIEQSADLYPYYDYALGYGVPQATFFTDKESRAKAKEPTFEFKESSLYVMVHPLAASEKAETPKRKLGDEIVMLNEPTTKEDVAMMKIQSHDGKIEYYSNLGFEKIDNSYYIAVPKKTIVGNELVVYLNGYTDTYRLSQLDSILYASEKGPFEYEIIDTAGYSVLDYSLHTWRSMDDNKVSNWGVGQKWRAEFYMQAGMQWTFSYDDMKFSMGANVGLRITRNFRKWYALGMGLDLAFAEFRFNPQAVTDWDNTLALTDFTNAETKKFLLNDVNLEFFQRIRLVNGGKTYGLGLLWDLGIYGGLRGNSYFLSYNADQNNGNSTSETRSFYDVSPSSDLSWGLTTRLTWEVIGIYARYRMSQTDLNIPRLELGIQLAF